MATNYTEAPEVQAIAATIIEMYHPHLKGIRVEYVFRSKAAKNKGRIVLGTARLVSGLNAFLASPSEADEESEIFQAEEGEAFFTIEIAKDEWKHLTDTQRAALVDHELCHCWAGEDEDADGNPKMIYKIIGHDVEEFTAIIQRHGLWKGDVQSFAAEAAKKLQPHLEVAS